MKRAALVLLALLLPLFVFAAGSREGDLVVAAAQFRVDASLLRTPADYERAVRRAAAEAGRSRHVDLIVFPEYTAAFFALTGIGGELAKASTSEELLAALRRTDPAMRTPADFFEARAAQTWGWATEVFGQIAREQRAWVVAGTCFASDGGGGLRNRALVMSPDGAVAYTQDKVFLTEIEEQMLRMSPGSVEAARGLRIRGRDVRLTICRDTFEPVWEERQRGADLWIDIKANGAAFTGEERASFARALPARLAPAAVPYGLTVCLTGSLLEFLWEGESSFVSAAPGATGAGPVTLAAARSASAAEVMVVRVPRR